MLKLKYMLEEDRSFEFMNGLQYWVQSELQHQNMQTLAIVLTDKTSCWTIEARTRLVLRIVKTIMVTREKIKRTREKRGIQG